MTVQEASAEVRPEPAGTCPRCGAPHDPGQLACLTCGTPLSLRDGREPRRSPWLIAAVAGAVLLAGAGLGYVVSRVADPGEVTNAEVQSAAGQMAQTAPPQSPPAAPPPAETAPPAGTAPAPAPAPGGTEKEGAAEPSQPVPGAKAGGKPKQWPEGKDAFTVVLLSARSRAGAQARARDAARAGVPAGVLRSSDYKSLRPGYWVVFAGQFSSQEQARRAQGRYGSQGFAGGYVRYVDAR
jgi:hypothetical protein